MGHQGGRRRGGICISCDVKRRTTWYRHTAVQPQAMFTQAVGSVSELGKEAGGTRKGGGRVRYGEMLRSVFQHGASPVPCLRRQ